MNLPHPLTRAILAVDFDTAAPYPAKDAATAAPPSTN